MKAAVRSVGQIGLLGGLGGAINAALCYAKLPMETATFHWHVIPAGAMHGLLLAGSIVWVATLVQEKPLWVRALWAPITGWIAGYVSWMPLNASVGFGWQSFYEPDVALLWWPVAHFGLVALLWYLWLGVARKLTTERLLTQLVMGSLSGILGSLWWWISWQPWVNSLLHGAIWGSLVGFGVWKTRGTLTS